MLRTNIKNRGWLSDEKLDEGIALVQLYPGPVNFDYAAYLGYQTAACPGGDPLNDGFRAALISSNAWAFGTLFFNWEYPLGSRNSSSGWKPSWLA